MTKRLRASTCAACLSNQWPECQLVAACANGVDAWDEALALEPDVCFLDIRMPGLTGLQVAQRLSALQESAANRLCHRLQRPRAGRL